MHRVELKVFHLRLPQRQNRSRAYAFDHISYQLTVLTTYLLITQLPHPPRTSSVPITCSDPDILCSQDVPGRSPRIPPAGLFVRTASYPRPWSTFKVRT